MPLPNDTSLVFILIFWAEKCWATAILVDGEVLKINTFRLTFRPISDMALFKHFEEHFGYTKKCLMETTYRFGEPAIEQSSKFILANPEQATKIVHSFRQETETKLDFISTLNRDDIVETIKSLSDKIPSDKEILLLGRYSFDVNIFKNTSLSIHEIADQVYVYYDQRRMRFLTVHQSKGLESDYVILINCNGGTMGFPADIADSPVLKYVLTEPDVYAFGEERRVFYVGITRAKKHTWVLYDKKNPSSFIKEFVDVEDQNTELEDNIPAQNAVRNVIAAVFSWQREEKLSTEIHIQCWFVQMRNTGVIIGKPFS